MAAQQAQLQHGFEVLNPDRPGYGCNSDLPNLPGEHLYWIEYLEQQNIDEPVHLLGVSQGARIALRMAAVAPSKVASLVVHGAAVDGLVAPEVAQPIPLAQYISLVQSDRLGDMQSLWLSHPMMSEGLSDEQLEQVALIVSDYRGRDLIHAAGHDFSCDADLIERLKSFAGPVLITTGVHEAPERQFHARWLRDNLQNAEYSLIDGAGHLANLSHAAEFNGLIRAFYRRNLILG